VEDQQPIHIAREVIEDRPVKSAHERPGTVQLPGADPQEGGLRAHSRDAFGQGESLSLGRSGFARYGVAGLRRGVGMHRFEHHPGIREGRLFSSRRSQEVLLR
jgi:hypothetical protein